jgi:AcrR family transcriptional regulator
VTLPAVVPHILRADARANRERILRAAQAVFRERGIDAEMKEVAARAGASIGTLYRNFPTRQDLVIAMFADCEERVAALLARADAMPDPVEGIRALFADGFALAEEKGAMMDAFRRELPGPCSASLDALDPIGKVAALLQRGVAAGAFRPGLDAEIAAARLLASFEPFQYARLRRNRTADEIAAAHLSLFLHEIGAEAPSANDSER